MRHRNRQSDHLVETGVLEPPEVHEAAGMIAARYAVAVPEALARLRALATHLRQPLDE